MNENSYSICFLTNIQAKRVVWEMTGRCTRRCPYCFIPQETRKQKDPPLETIIHTMDLLKKLGYTDVQVTGGEFFIRKDAVDILKAFHERQFDIAISTNGDLLNETIIEKIQHFSIRSINFSLDSHRASIHNAIRGVDSFEKTMKAIELCRKLPIRIRVQSVLSGLTRDHIHEVPFFLDSLGIYLHIIAAQFPNIEFYDEELASRLQTTIQKLPHMKIIPLRICLRPNQVPAECKACVARGSLLHISPSGKLTDCSLALRSSFPDINIFMNDEKAIIAALKQYESQPSPTTKPLCVQ